MAPMPRPLELTDAEIETLPVDRLGLEILRRFVGGTEVHLYNYLNSWRNAGLGERSATMRALSEACDWLQNQGLVSEGNGVGVGFVTRLGHAVVERGLGFLGAVSKLGADLHPQISSVRSQFLLGEYELAAFAAMRQVDVRVRQFGDFEDADIGRGLMRAFSSQESVRFMIPPLSPASSRVCRTCSPVPLGCSRTRPVTV